MLNISLYDGNDKIKKVGIDSNAKLVMPSDFLIKEPGIMKYIIITTYRGYNTYSIGDSLYSSVMGYRQKVEKLICVDAIHSRFRPEVGDVVIGRTYKFGTRHWVVDIGARHLANLNTMAIIPPKEKRQRTVEDVRNMADFLSPGDLIVAEVHLVTDDGLATLQMRSLMFGKLPVGGILRVSQNLIKKSEAHFHFMDNALVIVANNGVVWISPRDASKYEISDLLLEPSKRSSAENHLIMSRYRNIIEILAESEISLNKNIIKMAYDYSLEYQPKQLLLPCVVTELIDRLISSISS